MGKLNIEQSIQRSIAEETPDLLDCIMETPVKKMERADFIVRQQKNRRRQLRSYVYATFASFAMLFAICFLFISDARSVDSVIGIDVNPSIEIKTNKHNKILSVSALNSDGTKILSGQSFKNKDLDETVNLIVDSMVKQGYIDNNKNSVLVSVQNKNESKATSVKSTVVSDVSATLEKNQINGTVYNQNVNVDKKLQKLAAKYGISYGKMVFIYNITKLDSELKIEDLVSLTVEEITDLVEKREIALDTVVECTKNNQTAATTEEKEPVAEPKTTEEDNGKKATAEEKNPNTDGKPSSTAASQASSTEEAAEPKLPTSETDIPITKPSTEDDEDGGDEIITDDTTIQELPPSREEDQISTEELPITPPQLEDSIVEEDIEITAEEVE
ncbi:MAG: hypothetical protein II331_03185 [Lachnospiraceae bacterium]|nr:hypothetical protein [Lachnospiraceae bacterium]